MAGYAVPINFATLTSGFTSVGIVTAAASSPRRGKVFEFTIGASSNPNATDTLIQLDISRQTVAGTTTAVTPRPLDPADAACSALAGANATAEGTVTANSSVWTDGMNQRGTIDWKCKDGKELVWPATASNGFAFRALSPTYVGNLQGTVYFDE